MITDTTQIGGIEDFAGHLWREAQIPERRAAFARVGINPEGQSARELFFQVDAFARGKTSSQVREALGDLVPPNVVVGTGAAGSLVEGMLLVRLNPHR